MVNSIAVSITIICDNQDAALKASEVLQRAAIGLALEGLSASMSFMQLDDQNEVSNDTSLG